MNTRMKIVVLESVAVGLAISCFCIMGVYMYKHNNSMKKVQPSQQPSIICNNAHEEHVIEDASKEDLEKKKHSIKVDASDTANLKIISNNFINQELVNKETAAENKKKEKMQKEARKRLNVQAQKEKKEVKKPVQKAAEVIASSSNFQNNLNKFESASNSNMSQSELKKSKLRNGIMQTSSISANPQKDSDIVQNSEQEFDLPQPLNDHPQESNTLFSMAESNGSPLLQDKSEPSYHESGSESSYHESGSESSYHESGSEPSYHKNGPYVSISEPESNILDPVKESNTSLIVGESNTSISEKKDNLQYSVKEHNIPHPPNTKYVPATIMKETTIPMIAYSTPISEPNSNIQYSVKESSTS
ncbi:hypothetical protein NEAUS06_2182, partial [Nematocida ausubeli]